MRSRVGEDATDLLIQAEETFSRVLDDPMRYGPEAQRLVRRAREQDDQAALVVALRGEAWYRRSGLQVGVALRLLDEALRVARRHGLQAQLGELLVTHAAVAHELGRLPAAHRDLDDAERVLNGAWNAGLALQQAALHHNVGRLDDAARLYRRILAEPEAGAGTDTTARAKAANNLAELEARRGRFPVALRWIEVAEQSLATGTGPALSAIVVHNHAWITMLAGQFRVSLELFEQASGIFRRAGLPMGDHLIDYAQALAELRLIPEALDAAEQAVATYADERVPLVGAEAMLRLGQLALLAGDAERALRAGSAARDAFRRQRRTAWTARATVVTVNASRLAGRLSWDGVLAARRAGRSLVRLGVAADAVEAYLTAGQAAAELGRTADATRDLLQARRLSLRGPLLVRLRGDVAAAQAARLAGDDAALLRHCRSGLARVASHRAALPSSQLRALASGHGAELGQLGLRVLLARGGAHDVLAWLERNRSTALLLAAPPAGTGSLDALHEVQAQLDATRAAGAAAPAALLARQQELERRVRQDSWVGAASPAATPATPLPRIRAELDGRALISYGTCDGEVFAVVVTAGATRLVALAPERQVGEEVDALLFALRRLARPGSPRSVGTALAVAHARLGRLRQQLIAPLALDPDAPLVLIPPARLLRMPWPALHPAPVSVSPSATVWYRTAGQPAPSGQVALVAGPRLAGAVQEVAALATSYPDAVTLLPPDSTPVAVRQALDGASLAHLACHGVLRADNPMFSELVLSGGSLTVHELDVLGSAPHRVVLAACDAAADSAYEGEEVFGFVSALLARGTAGIIASTADVPDVPAVDFVTGLHEAVRRGARLADALFEARSRLDLQEPAGLVTWASFSAYGAG